MRTQAADRRPLRFRECESDRSRRGLSLLVLSEEAEHFRRSRTLALHAKAGGLGDRPLERRTA